MSGETVRIVSQADELPEGLFGQVILYVFEVLPYLRQRGSFPDWSIKSRFYGGDQTMTIPGVLDLAYRPGPVTDDVPLSLLRDRHCSQLGNDWRALNELWSAYFRVPDRVERKADELGSTERTLGVHYRGTDKLAAAWDTNPVERSDMTAIINDFLHRRPEIDRIFVATDDDVFAGHLRHQVDREVIDLGPVGFHKTDGEQSEGLAKADRALLDCVVLSRCRAVLKTSSALSAFTKVLKPELEIYRCAASKLFADIPYFPVAFIPLYRSDNPEIAAILSRLMSDDWTEAVSTPSTFRSKPRNMKRELKWAALELLRGAPVR
ncbi:hypothetical protein [uncultured Sphingomonas sp.]|uniref:hypothetical protein n=1 Tax=uncultured Sphingomonas sp. TaxID=158754 RepID=UPI0035CBB534